MSGCQINEAHCENCGSTSPEDVGHEAMRRNDGYTDCCNELRAMDRHDCRNHHGEDED